MVAEVLVQLLLLQVYRVAHLFLAPSLLLAEVGAVVVLRELVVGLPVVRVAAEPVGQRVVLGILPQQLQVKEILVELVRQALLTTALAAVGAHLRLVLMVLLLAEQMAALDLHRLSQEHQLLMQAAVAVALLVAGLGVVGQAAEGLEQIAPQQAHQELQTLAGAVGAVD